MDRGRSSEHPGRFQPEVIETFMRWYAPIVRRMWPATRTGFERLPDHDRFIVIANHSGVGVAELWAVILAWHESMGDEHPVAGMAHPGAFRVPPIRWFLQGLGAVEATRPGAAWARQHGVPLLLFPGGDHESTRPFWRARDVDFGGRKGWIRLAREHGLTIVPMCITGSHLTNPILAGGKLVAYSTGLRALGIRRAPLTALGLAAAWTTYSGLRRLRVPRVGSGLAATAALWCATMVPWVPAKIGFHMLEPLTHEALGELDDETVYARVVGELQRTLRADRSGSRR